VSGEVWAIQGGQSAVIAKIELQETNLQLPPGRCVIATAAYGSNLAAPVQFLRDFRDHDVQKTFLGNAFLSVFNAWYYSWAPSFADIVSQNGVCQATVRAMIAPLVAVLILTHAIHGMLLPMCAEVAVLVSGLFAGILIGMCYLTPLVYLPSLTARLGKARCWLVDSKEVKAWQLQQGPSGGHQSST